MEKLRILSRVALFVSAMALVLQISPVGADGGGKHHGRRAEVTFTVWVLNGGPFKAGFTGGDIEGALVGEIFENVPSRRVPSTTSRIEVIYEVQAGDRSFTALLQGGHNKPGGVVLGSNALLDGFILTGWRTGAQVHLEWVAMASPSVDCGYPAPAGAGPFCFVGTMTIERAAHDDDDHD